MVNLFYSLDVIHVVASFLMVGTGKPVLCALTVVCVSMDAADAAGTHTFKVHTYAAYTCRPGAV